MAVDSSEKFRHYFTDKLQLSGQYTEQDISQMEIPDEILKIIPEDIILQYHVIPFSADGDGDEKKLLLFTDTELTFKRRAVLEGELGRKVKLVSVQEENLRLGLIKFYGIQNFRSTNQMRQNIETDMTPLKGAINAMLQDAARCKASDIHMLPQFQGYRVVFRINGHPYDVTEQHNFTEGQMTNVANLIKQMDTSGSADIMRTNMPNEGSFYISHGGQDIFIRLETLPVGNGNESLETMIIRLLPQASKKISDKKTLDDIGYTANDLRMIKQVLYRNSTGLFLNSGPTGSGKTTSLHAEIHYVLDNINEPLNVIEIAEPIEIYEDNFTQVQTRRTTNEATNLPADKILEASLRCDPDIILFNEIRNANDAKVAVQASNTGHMVFSTVHAADVSRTILRLLDFDVSKITLLSELKLIISQRLVARLCPYCKKPHVLTEQERNELSKQEITQCNGKLFERADPLTAGQCQHCNNGLIGRTAIAEYVVFNNEIRDALLGQHSFSSIMEILRKNGFQSMWEKGWQLAIQGEIALDDLIHAVGTGKDEC